MDASQGDRRDARFTGTRLLQGPANGRTGVWQSRCEFVDIFSGEECRNAGEDRYEGKPLCRPHARLLVLEHRLENLLVTLSVLDKWLEDNVGRMKDEVCVQRIKHWRTEVLEQLEAVSEELE